MKYIKSKSKSKSIYVSASLSVLNWLAVISCNVWMKEKCGSVDQKTTANEVENHVDMVYLCWIGILDIKFLTLNW